jgi:mRNA-degrading endonuclease YafQ of YafQ-DinJ toxin-antitoxin module
MILHEAIKPEVLRFWEHIKVNFLQKYPGLFIENSRFLELAGEIARKENLWSAVGEFFHAVAKNDQQLLRKFYSTHPLHNGYLDSHIRSAYVILWVRQKNDQIYLMRIGSASEVEAVMNGFDDFKDLSPLSLVKGKNK